MPKGDFDTKQEVGIYLPLAFILFLTGAECLFQDKFNNFTFTNYIFWPKAEINEKVNQ
jgi:hypothetical protein